MKGSNILSASLALFLLVSAIAAQEAARTPAEQDQQKSEQGKPESGDAQQKAGSDQPQAVTKKVPPVSVNRKPISPTVDSTGSAATVTAAAEKLSRIPGDFTIAPVSGSPILYNITLWESSQRVSVTVMVNISQLRAYTSIMEEARKFAAGGEGVGKTKPVITRFYDKDDPAFFVDVSKMAARSQFFVTVKGREASVTVDAGTLKRGEGAEEMFFNLMLARLHESADKPAAQNQ